MKKIIRYILIILIILDCILIYKFSSQQSEQSNESSGRVINFIIEVNPLTKDLSFEEKEELKEKIVLPIRKTAHFTVYASLGALLYSCTLTYDNLNNKKKLIISFILAFLYACSDEIHQLLVPGRSGRILDIFIDSMGAICGISIVYIIFKLIKKIKLKNN